MSAPRPTRFTARRRRAEARGGCAPLAPLLAAVALAAGCAEGPAAGEKGPAREGAAQEASASLFVSIAPQAWLAERLLGEGESVGVLVGPEDSPATYDPSAREMARLAEAPLLVTIGVPFERALLPRVKGMGLDLRIVDGLAGIERVPMSETCAHHAHEGEHGHAHGHDHDHVQGEAAGAANEASAEQPDPHVWLDPQRFARHAETMARALEEQRPEMAAEIEARLGELEAELAALDDELAERLAPHRGRKLFVFHPAYGYFALRYGLEQRAVEVEGREPSARELAALIEEARSENARVIFVQPQFSQRSAEALAAQVGARVVAIDPLARDYAQNLRTMAREIAAAFEEQASAQGLEAGGGALPRERS